MSRKCWFNLALFASLALNVFFIGSLMSGTYENIKMLSPSKRIASYVETLPEPKRSKALEIIAAYKPRVDARISQLKQSRSALQNALKSDDYSRKDTQAKLVAMQKSVTAMQAIIGEMILDISEHLSPAERAKLFPPRMKGLHNQEAKKPAPRGPIAEKD
jgi:uncharacterized membrane protein